MTDDKDLKQVSHLVPEDVRDEAKQKAEYGELSDAVRVAYRMIASGSDISAVRMKLEIEQIEKRLESLSVMEGAIQEEREELLDRRDELNEMLSEMDVRSDKFEKKMEEVEELIRDGMTVFPDHSKIQDVARTTDKTPEEVISMLKDRNPEIPEYAFEKSMLTKEDWEGV
jgi:chromosome segregation ATPase